MDNKILYYLDEIHKIKHGEFVPPVSVEIDPSNKCNANCSWCMFSRYRKDSHIDMPWKLYLKIIYELKHLGVKSITFTGGGEPLMNSMFNDMVKLAKELEFEIGLVTNGIYLHRLLHPEYFKFIRVSLDAYDKELYKEVKGVDEFEQVILNIKNTLKVNKNVGISYVIGFNNSKNLEKMEKLAEYLGVLYCQFKPIYDDNKVYKYYKVPNGSKSIETKRYIPDHMCCVIAHLTGIITADCMVWYCCQGRGLRPYCLGNLSDNTFEQLWKRRLNHTIDISACPPCRYANYYNAYKKLISEESIFFKHRNFL